jgi:hypothetical protein
MEIAAMAPATRVLAPSVVSSSSSVVVAAVVVAAAVAVVGATG